MVKILRNITIILCVISCVSIAAGPVVKPNVRAQVKKSELTEDPYKDSTILIEAFVVEVRLSALYDLGVSPIGEKPNSVSIDNILLCLQNEGNAKICSGAKVATRQREQGETEAEQRIYLEQQNPTKTTEGSKKSVVSRPPRPYQFGKSFRASANILTSNKIYVSFSYNENALNKVLTKDNMSPHTVNWQWSGAICLEKGKASIVGATQDEKNAAFLILCADFIIN